MRIRYEVFHPNVDEVVNFYRHVLRFELVGRSAGPPAYATLNRDGVQVGCAEWPGASTVGRWPGQGSEIVFVVEDIEAELHAVRASGHEVDEELVQRPWGLRDFRLFDPSGQYLRLTE